MGQAWFLKPVILAKRKQRLGESQFKADLRKKFCLPSYVKTHEEEDQSRWPRHKARPQFPN
jgi:hypothetical protein